MSVIDQLKYLTEELRDVISVLHHQQEIVLLAQKIGDHRHDLQNILKEIEGKYWTQCEDIEDDDDILTKLEEKLGYPPYILELNILQFITKQNDGSDWIKQRIHDLWYEENMRGYQVPIFRRDLRAVN